MIKVMLLEDEELDTKLIKSLLKGSDFYVEDFKSVRAAAAVIDDFQPQIIISDLNLEDTKGYETLKKVRQLCGEIPLIIITGLEDEEYIQLSLDSGAYTYIEKNHLSRLNLQKELIFCLSRARLASNLKQARRETLDYANSLISVSKYFVLGEMAEGIAEKIRAPLSNIQNVSEVLHKKLDENIDRQVIKDELKKIEQNSQEISKVIATLQNAVQPEATVVQKVDLKDLIETTMRFCSQHFQKMGINFSFDEFAGIYVACDKFQVVQVLLTLIHNARVDLAFKTDSWIKFQFIDDEDVFKILVIEPGEKLESAVADRIFSPLTSALDEGEGKRLGLSVSRRIMEQNHGRLFLDKSDEDTCFVVELKKLS